MTTHDHPPVLDMLHDHPNSPPMTPGIHNHPHYMSQPHRTPPFYKRMGVPKFAHTPPLELTPIGQGQFKFTRAQSLGPSSRPSSISGRAYAGTTPQETEYEGLSDDSEDPDSDNSDDSDDSSEASDDEDETFVCRPETPEFELEELDSDQSDDDGIEVVQPDNFEDAKSERSFVTARDEDGVMNKFRDLQVSEESADELELEKLRYLRKKKRWSAGVFKRTHAQSVEGDSSYSDDDPLDDNDPTARRLRRKVRGSVPHDRRGSLMFEDKGFPNTNNIEEVEEPEEGVIVHTKGPPSIPSDDAFTLDELPFWGGTDELMDVGFGSS
jgi:hypothetical protein